MENVSTERSWTEAMLNASAAPSVLMALRDGKVLFENDAARALPWRMADDGNSKVTFTDQDGRELAQDQMPDVRTAAGEILNGLHVSWRSECGEGAFLAHSKLLPAMAGHEATALLTFLDVTELHRMQRSLKDATLARESFMSVAAHELKTPLTTLTLQLQRLSRAYNRGEAIAVEKARDATAHLQRSTARLSRLVEELLDVSRIVGGHLELERTEVDLSEVVRSVTSELHDDFGRAGCTLKLNAPSILIGNWDRHRLEQVVLNLTANALKYGAGKPVEIAVVDAGDEATIMVRDHGIGIAREDQRRIFGRFERVPNRNFGGLGLGLWIVERIVTGLGGRVEVESEPQLGSKFLVHLPLAAGVANPTIASAA